MNDLLSKEVLQEQSVSFLYCIDFSKAFNLFRHREVINILISAGLRKELVLLLVSYFNNRTMIVRWQECLSDEKFVNGGLGAGTLLAICIFVHITSSLVLNVDLPLYKCVDDMSGTETKKIKECFG